MSTGCYSVCWQIEHQKKINLLLKKQKNKNKILTSILSNQNAMKQEINNMRKAGKHTMWKLNNTVLDNQ